MQFKTSLFLSTLFAAAAIVAGTEAPDPVLAARCSNSSGSTPRNAVYSTLWKDTTVAPNTTHINFLPLFQNNNTITHVYLFNLEVKPSGVTYLNNVTLDYYTENGWLLNQTKNLQSKGVKVLASAGGAGAKMFQAMDENFDFYYTRLNAAIKHLNVDGLDLDIEVPTKLNTTLKILRRLHADFGDDFILTLAPVQQTFWAGPQFYSGMMNYTTLDRLATAPGKPNGKLIDWYNAQFYGDGAEAVPVYNESSLMTYYEKIVAAGFEPERVVMTIPTYFFDHGRVKDWWPIATYQQILKPIVKKYGDRFGGIAGYEYFNAGLDDKNLDRWQWVRDIGIVLFGNSTASGD